MSEKVIMVRCPFCNSGNVTRNGHNKTGKQVYNCNRHHNFVEDYTYHAYKPEVRQQVLNMAVDCTGTRATSRIPGISKDTVTAILKKPKIGLGR